MALSEKKSIQWWIVFGFISNFIILSAYYVTLPLEGVSSIAGFVVITGIAGGISLLLGLLYYPVGYFLWKLGNSTWKRFFVFISMFTLAEIARPYVFTIITWGGGSTFGAHGSSWALGSILAVTPFLSFTQYGGVFALGVVLAYIGGSLAFPFSIRTKVLLLSFLIACTVFLRLVPQSYENPAISFAVIQTSFPHVAQGEDIDEVYAKRANETVHPLVMSVADTHPDIIILPEDLRYIDLLSSSHKKELVSTFPNTLIADGATRFISGKRKNVSILYDTKDGSEQTRAKGFMFPFGEYVPYILQPFISLIIGPEKLASYQALREYSSGEEPYSFTTRIGRVGVLICSELTSGSAIASLKSSRPDIVIVQASLTWTHNSPYYMMNHILSLKMLDRKSVV